MGIFRKGKLINVLFLTTEEFPFAKVGGLGEVMFSLPRALRSLGHDVRVMLPRYGGIDKEQFRMSYVSEGLEIPTAPDRSGTMLRCNVLRYDATDNPKSPVTTYFLENQEYYELRSNAYGYADDQIRFALLSRGCLEFLNTTGEWMPDVIVATDWMAGYLPNFLKTDYREYVRLRTLASVFSIHNIYSQGPVKRFRFIPEMERDDGHEPIPDFFGPRMQQINAMRRGIMYADVVNTVSPTYANELMTPEFGEGLDTLLQERRGRVFGILNGIDLEAVNPEVDPILARTFSAATLDARRANKAALQERFGLPQDPDAFVCGVVSRLTGQKGFSLLASILEPFLRATRAQLIVTGTGDTDIMDFFAALTQKYPKQVAVHLQFDSELPRLIYGGSDILLIPSQFEPCGLTQMEAMRYGAIPVARRTGGLADSIHDERASTKRGTGFLFDEFEPTALCIAMTRAFERWGDTDAWRKLQKRAMAADFSWQLSATQYVDLFRKAMKLRRSGNA